VVRDERLAENAMELGIYFREEMEKLCNSSKIAKLVRGKGLMNALVINNEGHTNLAWDICLKLEENGLLAKPTQTNIIRFAPPLVMTKAELEVCIEIIVQSILFFEN